MILNCLWILLKCYLNHSILPILRILHNITNITQYYKIKYSPIFTNITFPILFNIPLSVSNINITQYYQYYSILLIQYYSIFLILKTVLFQFNIRQYYKSLEIFINIPQYYLCNIQGLIRSERSAIKT